MTETTPPLPAGGPPGLPGRIVARVRRDVPLAILDALVVVPAYLIPLVLRFHGVVPHTNWLYFWALLPGIAIIHLLNNYLFGLYGQMWKYASVQEARRVLLSGLMSFGCVLGLVIFVGRGDRPIPLSVIAIGSAFAMVGSGAIRFQSRLFAFRRRAVDTHRTRVLLMGAGEAGAQVLNDILRHPELGLQVVGIVDDDPHTHGRILHDVRVLGAARRSQSSSAGSARTRCCWRSPARPASSSATSRPGVRRRRYP